MSFFKAKLNVNDEALNAFEMIALTTLGHYVGKNNPEWTEDAEGWYAAFQAISKLDDFQEAFNHATHSLVDKFIDDEFVQLQVKTLLSMLKIELSGPTELKEMPWYRKIVDAFMAGMKTAK